MCTQLGKKRLQLKKMTRNLPTELTTTDLLLIPARGRPNLFFQHGAMTSDRVNLHTARLFATDLPQEITFFLRLKHVDVRDAATSPPPLTPCSRALSP